MLHQYLNCGRCFFGVRKHVSIYLLFTFCLDQGWPADGERAFVPCAIGLREAHQLHRRQPVRPRPTCKLRMHLPLLYPIISCRLAFTLANFGCNDLFFLLDSLTHMKGRVARKKGAGKAKEADDDSDN